MYTEIKDFTFDTTALKAYGKLTIPESRMSEKFYGISIWLKDVAEPITVTYEDEDERDAHLVLIKESLLALAEQYSS